jgi:uncharacterized membrane protein
VWSPDGKITEFDAGDDNTNAMSINSSGRITGSYFYGGLPATGFLRSPHGKITSFSAFGDSTSPLIINNRGDIAGGYFVSGYHVLIQEYGFILSRNGTMTGFAVPAAIQTSVQGLNDRGSVAGSAWYPSPATAGFFERGFVRATDGTITVIDIQGAREAWANGINNSAIVVGDFEDMQYVVHGFCGQVMEGSRRSMCRERARNVAKVHLRIPSTTKGQSRDIMSTRITCHTVSLEVRERGLMNLLPQLSAWSLTGSSE